MLSKATIKYIQSLKQKKYRIKHNAFLVEGQKMVEEAIASSYCVEYLVTTEKDNQFDNAVVIDESTMKKISSFSTSSNWMAVVKMDSGERTYDLDKEFALALDGVKDPGNLGTILRIADWYGIDTVVCSKETVDVFNPKTVQSTMGAFFRVNVVYQDLELFIQNYKEHSTAPKVYGALMDGENLYKVDRPSSGLLVMGSESHGISKAIDSMLTHRVTIPGSGRSESLNVAIATGILCSEFFRECF